MEIVFKKKRELLAGMSKRKMSLRKHIDDLRQSECTLEISEVTKYVFLASLCLKPVPRVFDSPLMLQQLDMSVKCFINGDQPQQTNEKQNGSYDETIQTTDCSTKDTFAELSNLQDISNSHQSYSEHLNNRVDFVKCEQVTSECHQNSEKSYLSSDNLIEIDSEIETHTTSQFNQEDNILATLNNYYDHHDDNVNLSSIGNLTISNSTNTENIPVESTATAELYDFVEDTPLDNSTFKLIHMRKPFIYGAEPEILPSKDKMSFINSIDNTEMERFKRESTPELILSDSDEDAIDQLMLNIMDIKVGPNNVLGDEFFDIPASDEEDCSTNNNKNDSCISDKNTWMGESDDSNHLKRIAKCKICSKEFRNYTQLKKHKEFHCGEKPYLCLKCNENHPTLDQLIAHLRTHQGKHPYICKKCNKGFKTTKALETHKSVHVLKKISLKTKSYKCDVCKKEFRKLCDLERHTRVHTGEKPSVCNICNRRFQQAHNLTTHLLIHTNVKPFECEVCNKRFGRNDVLNRHLLTHSVRKPNDCNICNKSFIRPSQLIAHQKKYHITMN